MARRSKEGKIKMAASRSANALNRAMQNLDAVLTELCEAHANAHKTSCLKWGEAEKALYLDFGKVLYDSGLHKRIKDLRDRRAARVGFSGSELDGSR